MSKMSAGGGGSSKGGKSRSSGGAVKVETSKPRQTAAIDNNIIILRSALRDDFGKDKDVTKDIARAFMKFDRNGLDLSIEFATKLTPEEAKWAFNLAKDTMEDKYDDSGYGWNDDDKMSELTEKGTRFLIAREWPSEEGQKKGEPVAFVHFRFTVQGEVVDQMAGEPGVYIYDIHVEDHSQKKGLGKHLLTILELIARREKMKLLSLPIQLGDCETKEWLLHVGRGWAVDESLSELGFDADVEGFHVYSKVLADLTKKPVVAAPAAAAAAPAAAAAAPAVTAAPAAAAAAAPVAAPATSSPVESVFKLSSSAAPVGGTEIDAAAAVVAGAATPGSAKTETEEVEGGWLCL